MLVFYNKVSKTITKYYYLYVHNNKDSYIDVEIPELKREDAYPELELLVV